VIFLGGELMVFDGIWGGLREIGFQKFTFFHLFSAFFTFFPKNNGE
jgi:hypothetical protein